MEYTVTIALPIYNVAQYVEKSLLSALNQTFDSIEYILVDDKGSDNSMDIVRSIIAYHPRRKDIRIIEHKKNIGLGAGRNTAIEHATGKYIFFMDSDDEIIPDCIRILYSKMHESPVDFVAASIINKERNGTILKQLNHSNKYLTDKISIVSDYYTTKKRHVFVWNKLYNLSFLRKKNIKCIPSHLNEDNIFTFQVILNASSCRFIPDLTYYYYDTPDSIVKKAVTNKITTRYAQQYTECIHFKIDYLKSYSDIRIRETVSRYIIFQTICYSINIDRSSILSRIEKNRFLKELIIYPSGISEIKKFKNKSFFYFMYILYALPFTLSSFKIINKLSSFKKK